MKKFLFIIACLPLFICGECGGDSTDTLLTPNQLDSLIKGDNTLPAISPTTTIDMDGIEDDPTTTVKIETVNNRQRVVLYLPEIENGPHIGKLNLSLVLAADTVQSFTLSATSAKAITPRLVDAPAKTLTTDYGKIKPNDSRYGIAKRLKVPISSILNTEPLKVGEAIRVKN